jgi:hypothetical protein
MEPGLEQRLLRLDEVEGSARGLALLRKQRESWPMLAAGFASLSAVEERVMRFGDVRIRIQFNPGRMTSSSAKVDEKSIRERRCFLCFAHLPEGQRGFLFEDRFLVLCNPFPILRDHLTIPHVNHLPQEILPWFPAFLRLGRFLGDHFTVFYNGPRAGASAPDHLHFQAGEKGFMGIEEEYAAGVGRSEPVLETGSWRITGVDDGLRRYLVIEGEAMEGVTEAFTAVHEVLREELAGEGEPMMNILSVYGPAGWRLMVIPRTRHRPSFFFAEGEERILLSPAAVDCGGVCTTPVEKDFRRLDERRVAQMFDEVMVPPEQFARILARTRARQAGQSR